jgi:hypothetical protein
MAMEGFETDEERKEFERMIHRQPGSIEPDAPAWWDGDEVDMSDIKANQTFFARSGRR